MFILRKFYKNGVSVNISLGKSYIVINKEIHPEIFNNAVSDGIIQIDPDIYGYVIGKDDVHHILFVNQSAYIMTESGSTFDNVTRRD